MQNRLRNRERIDSVKGFTLIEIMITVTIIGILASFATPAYKDYVVRGRVTEAASVFFPVKAAYTSYYSVHNGLPNSLDELPGISSNRFDFAGDYVRWLRVRNNGNVRIRTRNISKLGDAANKLMEFRPDVSGNSKNLNWTVFTRDNNNRWIPQKYLPEI